MSFLDLVLGGRDKVEYTIKIKETKSLILFIVKDIVDKPVGDELGLLKQGSEIRFGCDVFVLNVIFKLSLPLLQTQKTCT